MKRLTFLTVILALQTTLTFADGVRFNPNPWLVTHPRDKNVLVSKASVDMETLLNGMESITLSLWKEQIKSLENQGYREAILMTSSVLTQNVEGDLLSVKTLETLPEGSGLLIVKTSWTKRTDLGKGSSILDEVNYEIRVIYTKTSKDAPVSLTRVISNTTKVKRTRMGGHGNSSTSGG